MFMKKIRNIIDQERGSEQSEKLCDLNREREILTEREKKHRESVRNFILEKIKTKHYERQRQRKERERVSGRNGENGRVERE